MKKKKHVDAVLRVHPFPTLIAQTLHLVELASGADPAGIQVLAKSAVVFAAMSLECAATSCLELAKIPEQPFSKIETLSVLDKFDMLQWFATRTPLDRSRQVVQKIRDLIAVRNGLVHARVKREPFGPVREFAAGEGFEAPVDKSLWNSLRIPKDERSWHGEHAKHAITAAVEFLNYFFFEACKLEQNTVVQMLSTSSGTVIFQTPWEKEILSEAERRFGLKLRFLGFPIGR